MKFPFNKSNDPLPDGNGFWNVFAGAFWSYSRPVIGFFIVLFLFEIIGNWRVMTLEKFLIIAGLNIGACLFLNGFFALRIALSPHSTQNQISFLPPKQTKSTPPNTKLLKVLQGLLLLPQIVCIGLLIIGIYVSFINLNLRPLALLVFFLAIYIFLCVQSVRGKKKMFLKITIGIALTFLLFWIVAMIISPQYIGFNTIGGAGAVSAFISLILRYLSIFHNSVAAQESAEAE